MFHSLLVLEELSVYAASVDLFSQGTRDRARGNGLRLWKGGLVRV